MPQLSSHRCPYCFVAIPKAGTAVACPQGRLDNGQPCRGSSPGFVSKPELCPDHSEPLVPHCHSGKCGRAFPQGWSGVTTTCLVMAGTRSSGKTVYIGAAANQLARWGLQSGLTVTHYSPEHQRNFVDRFGRLDANASLYGSTEPEMPGSRGAIQQEPVILRLQRPGQRDHALVLRDVAGENLQDATLDREHFGFLARADGVILMVDASESLPVRSALHIEQPAHGFQPGAVWGNLEQLGREVLGEDARLAPVAVTLSKFDLVLSAADPELPLGRVALSSRGSRIRMDPSLISKGFDQADADLLHQELKSLWAHLQLADLVTRADVYAKRAPVRMFAVSSLGHAPALNRVAVQGAVPFRCLDPLKWFLAEAGVLTRVS